MTLFFIVNVAGSLWPLPPVTERFLWSSSEVRGCYFVKSPLSNFHFNVTLPIHQRCDGHQTAALSRLPQSSVPLIRWYFSLSALTAALHHSFHPLFLQLVLHLNTEDGNTSRHTTHVCVFFWFCLCSNIWMYFITNVIYKSRLSA